MSGRLRYTEPTFTLPSNSAKLTELEYQLRVGSITQEEFDRASTLKGCHPKGRAEGEA